MSAKEIEVDCPCCATRLVVDVLTQKVLKHVPKTELDDLGKPVRGGGRWEGAQARVTGRLSRGEEGFDSALDRERSRADDLDDLFDKAKSKLEQRKRDLE